MLEPVGGADASAYPHIFVNAQSTQRVNNDGTFTPIVNLTIQSAQYGVQFTFTILKATWDNGGAPAAEGQHTQWVDAVCAYPHVIGFHTDPEQGNDQVIYNYAKILVGPEGATDGIEVQQRMDHLGDASTFTRIDAAWKQLQDVGAQ